jgi:hypothetical protein
MNVCGTPDRKAAWRRATKPKEVDQRQPLSFPRGELALFHFAPPDQSSGVPASSFQLVHRPGVGVEDVLGRPIVEATLVLMKSRWGNGRNRSLPGEEQRQQSYR